MNINLEQFEAKRKEVFQDSKKYFIIGGVLLAVFIVLMVIGFMQDSKTPILLIVGIIGAIIGGLIIGIGSVKMNKVSKMLRQELVSKLIVETYPDASFDLEHGFSEKMIMEPGFFKEPDRFYSKNYFAGKYKDIPFEISDFNCEERHVHTDSKGNTTVTYETYAKGRMIVVDFKRDIRDTVKILETKWLGARTRGLEKIELESIDFNKKFTTYTDNDQTAFFILTPQIQLKLLEMEQKFRGSIFFSFQGGKLYIAINDNVDTLKFNVFKEINEDQLQTIMSQISLPAAVINELKLDSSKWTLEK